RLMDSAEVRHRVISHNLANVNTPGYHRQEVVFPDLFNMSKGEDAAAVRPIVRDEPGLPARADGNNVDIDREAVQLEKNALAYQTYSQLLTSHMQLMRRAVEG
ncbi:MAG: flagellar basal body rod protein FlgB, partial [Planctomycetaceae bacterium]|nr:flagellar basal body rod protein FlgB [Planctomycetaceae bacterium]